MKDEPHTTWRKSSHTSQEGGTCVELAVLNTLVGVRDSTDPEGPVLRFGRDGLTRLLERIKTGELDR
ncbi:DUF397 domain-containing protein [Actinomadura bangladeshensis]|uniref:DUF397 domain-containing protein n=1 Tax=Actinomadura bangladeshensis TaxID=453573 RepID=A0A6L9QAH6_9ACTN|nr:DUF397 domain-containing protein [Actinomadura bangladeshensis]NEA21294.1 DUF397 domain-containing protein [Actinomadura bangladeshensis]